MMFPLVSECAASGIPVARTCRVLKFSKQAYYRWLAHPVSDRDWDDAHVINSAFTVHRDDPEFGYRFIADELKMLASQRVSVGCGGYVPSSRCGVSLVKSQGSQEKLDRPCMTISCYETLLLWLPTRCG